MVFDNIVRYWFHGIKLCVLLPYRQKTPSSFRGIRSMIVVGPFRSISNGKRPYVHGRIAFSPKPILYLRPLFWFCPGFKCSAMQICSPSLILTLLIQSQRVHANVRQQHIVVPCSCQRLIRRQHLGVRDCRGVQLSVDSGVLATIQRRKSNRDLVYRMLLSERACSRPSPAPMPTVIVGGPAFPQLALVTNCSLSYSKVMLLSHGTPL